ncbi:rifamycin-inactivating phosphotransferase [Rhodococcus artemisiae]|uniref:Rifamycin-inactivating phosphotransferase n=1 Tax=Rhodococcus artemisiae TaxID=714159 RepID=A0ABU7L383_9NOCA|nr:rifamycin-inactivating phosphotransferase [Rhodococcus artemisiae]MEE2056000.1 rifamycin-inactivating phosphotransferase [Rhodococcus artemisiae]
MGYVLDFDEIDRTDIAQVGGKGANLGELARLAGAQVPEGFCVTTDAFRRVFAEAPRVEALIDRLSGLDENDREQIIISSAEIRRAIEECTIPDEVAAAIVGAHAGLGERGAYAVRSSATAEDLPNASFAGQQDTYLNVIGAQEILRHVSRCWASLFTDRSVTYRLRNGFDHRTIHMAVVVQRMAFPQASGILFTADPVTSDRTVVSIDAGFGFGEALVSGLVNADVYTVRDGDVTNRAVARKELAVEADPAGGTKICTLEPEQQTRPVLTDAQAVCLAQLGRDIEAHFGRPQDIEWCLSDDEFLVVQSRPITTLFPIPEAADDANRVYVSVGHQQMMTDAMKPLGLSVWQMTSTAPMRDAGGRLFVDVTERLASPRASAGLVAALGSSEPLVGDALRTLVERGFVRTHPDALSDGTPAPAAPPASIETDDTLVIELIADSEASTSALARDIRTRTGLALLDFIDADIQELRRILFAPRSYQAIMASLDGATWLRDHLDEWLGEGHAIDALTQSVPHNITSEMGLELLDVADVIRPRPEVVAFLHRVEDTGIDDAHFFDALAAVPGGREARDAIDSYLDKYGMRCVGEIDITRPRWREHPTALVPTILANVANFEPGAARRRFDDGLRAAQQKEHEVLERLRALPDGARKAGEIKAMIDRVRTFAGYREYPKYGMVSRYFVYKQALLGEAERLVQVGVLRRADDIFYLRFDELREVVRTQHASAELLREREEEFRAFRTLTPPRVLTSDGEIVTGVYRREDLPTGALPGLAVSTGVVEGRARVVSDIGQADLETGDILVTAYTDPSWTPLFVTIAGLVTEVGGLMTHGAVIAREYGLPAVVAVPGATVSIRDGQRIRVDGTDGYVEILSERM